MGTVQLRWTENCFERRFLVNVSEISEWVSLFCQITFQSSTQLDVL